MVNVELVRQGVARAHDDARLARHPALTAAQAEARAAHRGMWAPQALALESGGAATCQWPGGRMLRTAEGESVHLLGVLSARDATIDDAACAALRRRVEGNAAFLEVDAKLGESAGYYVVTTDGLLLNAEILRQGLGRVDPETLYRAPARAAELAAAEQEARAAGRGVWATNRIAGLETQSNCPFGFEIDDHQRCHLFRYQDGATLGLLGARLPTRIEYLHDEARRRAAELVAGAEPRLAFDPAAAERPGCDLAYLTLPDGRLVNVELVREGLARADVGDRPLQQAAALRAAEQEARQASRGLWAAGQVASSRVNLGVLWLTLRSDRRVDALTGVTIPNLGEGHDKAVTALVAAILERESVEVTTDPVLANLGVHAGSYVTLADGRSLNVELVRQGLAYATPLGQPYRLEEALRLAEQEARSAGRGLWAAHDVLGASLRGEFTVLVLRSGDARYDPPNLTVQLLGVDRWGGHAQKTGAVLQQLTTDQKVHLGFDPAVPRDPVLTPAYVSFADGRSLNAELVRQGVAQMQTHGGLLRLQRGDELAAAERAARDAQQGMWSATPIAPDPIPTLDPTVVAEALRPPKVSQERPPAPLAGRRFHRTPPD
jgi:endonuclease YncB( thermonuclease family)